MSSIDWVWRSQSVMFAPNHFARTDTYGLQPSIYASPHWMFSFTTPVVNEMTRRQIVAALEDGEGVTVFNVYDPRCPVPYHHGPYNFTDDTTPTPIPDLTVKATDVATRSIQVVGDVGDVITVGDPMAFIYGGRKHYYVSRETLVMTGAAQWLKVSLRPRYDLTGLDIVMDRKLPTNRFVLSADTVKAVTNSDGFTPFSPTGVEFFGVL